MLIPSAIVQPCERVDGFGLYATLKINVGTVVWLPCSQCAIYDGERQQELTAEALEDLDEYGYRLSNQDIIMPCSNATLLNHSCEAKVLDFGLDFGIAVRPILSGEEITIDYATFRADQPWTMDCTCGSATCRKVISAQPEVDQALSDRWMELIVPAVNDLKRVEQPLHRHLMESSECYADFLNMTPGTITREHLTYSILSTKNQLLTY